MRNKLPDLFLIGYYTQVEAVIERPKHKLGILSIYRVAFSTVLRCPAIYIASFFYWLLIMAAMIGVTLGVSIAWVSAVMVVPFFVNIFAGMRFFFGITFSLGLTWLAVLGLLLVLLKAGQAGMFLRLHQGDKPRLSDFGAGVVRYTWRFLKGYFHLIALLAIPLLFFYGWLVLKYAAYSSLIFESRWNMGLRIEFFRSIDMAWGIVVFISAVIWLLLLVWDRSVVLDGSTFQQSYIRSVRFVLRNPVRSIAVALVNLVILYLLWILAYRSFAIGPIFGLGSLIVEMVRYLFHQTWFLVLLFIFSPVLSYTLYLLYIPNLPFMPGRKRVDEPEVQEVLIAGTGKEKGGFVTLGRREPVEKDISMSPDEEHQNVVERSAEPEDTSIANDPGTEPDDDFLRLNE